MFCTYNCYLNFHKANQKEFNDYIDLSTGTIGAMAELIVGADLMRKGFEVFRAMSPSSYSDLIAIKNGTIHKVEVRTGNYFIRSDGTVSIHYPKKNTDGKFVVVVTHKDNKIHYINWD